MTDAAAAPATDRRRAGGSPGGAWEAGGVDAGLVLAELAARRGHDLPVHGGRTTAYVFDSGLAGLEDLAARAHAVMAPVNALDPTAFPSTASIENDLVATALAELGGGADAVGTLTSGGTESCLLAVLAARELHRERRGRTRRGRLVLPVSAHPAFHKGAHLFDLDVTTVAVDAVTLAPDPAAMAAAIDEDTALVVVSAPSYPHGVLDPVVAVAAAADAAGVPCHVDACIGGWVLPFLDAALPAWDLSVPGVTSLSVDLHKYGYAPKGVSLLLWCDAGLRRRSWFAFAGWPGYPLVNPTLASTRPAGPAAAAWAVLRHVGRDGFVGLARTARAATQDLVAGLSSVEGLHVLGAPVSTLVAVADDGGPDDPDITVVADELAQRGWFVQAQPAHDGLPASVHLSMSAAVAPLVPELVGAFAASADAARGRGRARPDPALLQAASSLDPATLSDAEVAAVLVAAGVSGGTLPERLAPVHALLGALPPALAERALIEVIGGVYRP